MTRVDGRLNGDGIDDSKSAFFCVAALLFVMATLSAAHAAGDDGMVEPKAGTWKTWIIPSGAALRPAAPPDQAATQAEIRQLKDIARHRDAAAMDVMTYWDTGAPSYRWNEIAVNEALKNALSWNFAGRHLALLNVAVYDAMVAAWDAKYAYKRQRPSQVDKSLSTALPNPRSPSYPSEHAVAAGAASEILAYVFPERAQFFRDKAEEAAKSRLVAGVQYPSDVTAGLTLGRQVAALVIERGKLDGSDAKWTGAVPVGPGKWNGTNPILPQMATWKPWVLSSPSEFRPPPPIPYDSPEKAAELAEIKNFPRTPRTNSAALFWEYAAGGLRAYQYWSEQTSRKILEYRLDANPPRAARVYAIQTVTSYDAGIACWDGKYAYWAIRPFQLDPEVKTVVPTPNHPSYPAAHGCISSANGAALANLFPRDAAAIMTVAEEASESRIWAGIHYRSDVVAGRKLGMDVANKVAEFARQDGAQ